MCAPARSGREMRENFLVISTKGNQFFIGLPSVERGAALAFYRLRPGAKAAMQSASSAFQHILPLARRSCAGLCPTDVSPPRIVDHHFPPF